MLMGCGGFILLTYPAMLVMSQGSVGTSIAAMSMLGVFVAMFNGGCGAAMVELFPTSSLRQHRHRLQPHGGDLRRCYATRLCQPDLVNRRSALACVVRDDHRAYFIHCRVATKETAGKVLD
jgi:hypothetical protein